MLQCSVLIRPCSSARSCLILLVSVLQLIAGSELQVPNGMNGLSVGQYNTTTVDAERHRPKSSNRGGAYPSFPISTCLGASTRFAVENGQQGQARPNERSCRVREFGEGSLEGPKPIDCLDSQWLGDLS